MTKVAPSILSADFANMERDCKKLSEAGADYIHCDVMDGSFVEQITFGTKMVEAVKKTVDLPLDVHLMIVNPQKHIENFCSAGSEILTIHYEAVGDKIVECIEEIKSYGVKAGMSLKPGTDIALLDEILPMLDLVLVMSVEPGKGGQAFMDSALDRIAHLKEQKKQKGLDFIIEVDGGINQTTGKKCVDAGADMLVAGSYVFKGKDIKEAVASLKKL